MNNKKYQNLEIPSDPSHLITVEEYVHYVASDVNLDESKISGLLLAITEATTNAIIHGNRKNIEKKVAISAHVENGILYFRIKDEGIGFDPNKIPDPTEPENLLKDSGRGLYLMRIYADELTYNLTSSGTETILKINLD